MPTMNLAHGFYRQPVQSGRVFHSFVVGQTTTVGTATTYTGLVLSNPKANTKNVNILQVGVGFSVAFAAASAVGLMCGFDSTANQAHTAATVIYDALVGLNTASTTATATCDSSSTLTVTPTVRMILGQGLTGAITTAPGISQCFYDLGGSVILKPGAFCAIYTSTASGTNSMNASFVWEETT